MTEEDDDVKIISSEDEKIKLIGEIFSNDSSRKILKLLSEKEMTANEVAQKNNMSLALVTHHLKRMQAAEMVKISKTSKSVKGQDMKYYIATKQSILIVPPEKTSQTILNSFKKFSKFAAIGMAGFVSWMTVKPDGENLELMPIHQSEQYEFSEDDIKIDTDASSVDVEEWTSASESSAPRVKDESNAELTVESESVPSHSGIEEFNVQVSRGSEEAHANTGSISLDRTVYPVPWESADTVEPFVFSILIPVIVVGAGILLERLLTRWYNKRKMKLDQF